MTGSSGEGFAVGSVARSAVVLMGGTLVAQLFIAVRELFLADQLGTSSAVDALLIGMSLPVSLGGVLTTGAMVAFVPAYVQARESVGRSHASRFAGAILAWVGLGGLIIWLALEMVAEPVVAVMGSGLAESDQMVAAGYLRVVAPVAFLLSISGILIALCQAEERFAAIAWSTVGSAASTLLVAILLWPAIAQDAYALGSLVGPAVGLLILIGFSARFSILPRPRFEARGLGLRAFVRHTAPLTVSSSILQLNVIINVAVASTISPGAVSAVRFGTLLVNLPVAAMSMAWGRSIYPALVRTALGSADRGLSNAVGQSLRYVFAVFVIVAVLTAAVAPLAVGTAFGRGAFTADSIDLTSQVVIGAAPVAVTSMVMPVLTGALNAQRRGVLLAIGGFMNVGLNLLLSVSLGWTLGVGGVALATSLTSIIVGSFFLSRLHRSDPNLRLAPIARSLGRALAAATPPALLIGFVVRQVPYDGNLILGLIGLIACGVAGVAGYLLLAPLVRYPDPLVIVRAGFGAMRRRRTVDSRST